MASKIVSPAQPPGQPTSSKPTKPPTAHANSHPGGEHHLGGNSCGVVIGGKRASAPPIKQGGGCCSSSSASVAATTRVIVTDPATIAALLSSPTTAGIRRDTTPLHADFQKACSVTTTTNSYSSEIASTEHAKVLRSRSYEVTSGGSRVLTTQHKVVKRAKFTIGSDSTDDESSLRKSKERESHRQRFVKRILNPLRRSHSTGSTKDMPAHVSFFKQMDAKHKDDAEVDEVVDHLRVDGTCSSEEEHAEMDSKKKKQKKTFTQDMKAKLAFLRRRHTDTSLSSKAADPRKALTKEAVLSWQKSFDNLLHDPCGLEMFRHFLRTEFSDENLEFWILCQEYRTLKSSKQIAQANRIFTDFVAIQAAREINLDSKTRLAVRDQMAHPNKHTFVEAQRRIQGLMEKDSYPRFLQSDEYLKLCKEFKIST